MDDTDVESIKKMNFEEQMGMLDGLIENIFRVTDKVAGKKGNNVAPKEVEEKKVPEDENASHEGQISDEYSPLRKVVKKGPSKTRSPLDGWTRKSPCKPHGRAECN